MAINPFEGARRFALLITTIAVASTIFYVYDHWGALLPKEIGEYLTNLGLGLAFFWIAVWSVGWIVRGFLGIPRGADRKLSARNPDRLSEGTP